ncbi:MAG: type II toxin-antitoxin system HicB family antitoxin [Bacteroidetes bacterium]|nr:MAG: type II toxin-antitoxin system HicB family antitoxin [Bacteroidota bacterium]
MKKYLIVIEKTKSGFSAYSPDILGCAATGKTKKEVEKNMYEAIQFHLEGLTSEGLHLPENKTESEMLVFAVAEPKAHYGKRK